MSEHRFSVPNPDGSEYSLCEFCGRERGYRPILDGPCKPKVQA
jgi:hypothetical protein